MKPAITLFSTQFEVKDIIQRMLLGAVIGLLVISFFVFGVDHPNPSWPANWRIRPLVITPIAAAFGILSFYLGKIIGIKTPGFQIFITIISIILFIISLWLGTVLGLAGTMWD